MGIKQKAGLAPRFPFCDCVLPPMPFYHYPSAVAMDPTVGDPMRMWIRWTLPVSRNPDIVVACPTLIAGNPDESPLRRWTGTLVHGSRRPHAYYDLRKGGRREQNQAKQSCQCNLFHDQSILLVRLSSESTRRSGQVSLPTRSRENSCAPAAGRRFHGGRAGLSLLPVKV
jgi:hypothetical protein